MECLLNANSSVKAKTRIGMSHHSAPAGIRRGMARRPARPLMPNQNMVPPTASTSSSELNVNEAKSPPIAAMRANKGYVTTGRSQGRTSSAAALG